MKQLILILTVLLAVISCTEKTTVDYAIVSGNIKNAGSNEISLYGSNSFKKVIAINEDGSFTDTLRVSSGKITMYNGKNVTTFYLEPGYNLHITYDGADHDNTIQFSGKDIELSEYFTAKAKKESELTGGRLKIYELEEADFLVKIKEIRSALNDILSSTEGIPEAFKIKEKRSIQYAYLMKLNSYESSHQYVSKNRDFAVSDGFLNELDKLDYTNEEDYFYSEDYKSLVNIHYRHLSIEMVKTDSIERDIAFLKAVETCPNGNIKDDLLYGEARYGITYTRNLEEYFATFNSVSSNEEHRQKIADMYKQLKLVSAGQPSPKFTDYENYNGGTTSLDDLKGKYVYIDVWATWCGPCNAEIPYLKEVEKQYHEKNIEFVSISVDKPSDRDKWRAMIAEKELGGIQLMADNVWESKFVSDYLIRGIPHFILIDPEGKIVEYSAPRPSNKELIDLFDKCGI